MDRLLGFDWQKRRRSCWICQLRSTDLVQVYHGLKNEKKWSISWGLLPTPAVEPLHLATIDEETSQNTAEKFDREQQEKEKNEDR